MPSNSQKRIEDVIEKVTSYEITSGTLGGYLRFHNPKKEELFFSIFFFKRPCKEGNSSVVSAVSNTMGRHDTD
jgi:hypothetical protein